MSSTTSALLIDPLLLLHHQTCQCHCLLLFTDRSSLSELCEGLGILVPDSFPITAKERLYDLINKCAMDCLSLLHPPAIFAMHLCHALQEDLCLGLSLPSSLDICHAVTELCCVSLLHLL